MELICATLHEVKNMVAAVISVVFRLHDELFKPEPGQESELNKEAANSILDKSAYLKFLHFLNKSFYNKKVK